MSLPVLERADRPTLLDSEAGRFSFWSLQNVTIVVWQDQPTREGLLRLQEAAEPRTKAHPEGLSDIHLITGRIGFPDEGTRQALVRASKLAVPHLAAVAVMVGGAGFWTSAMRSLITGMRVLVPGPFEMAMFGTIDELVQWLPDVHAKRTGTRIDAAVLKQVLTFVCDSAAVSGEVAALQR